MRDVERLLVIGNLFVCLMAGLQGEPVWLLLPLASFGAYVYLEDRALRLRMSHRAWPSEGFARFTLNTNLFLMAWNVVLDFSMFGAAGLARSAFLA